MSCAPAFAANLCRAYSGARRCREQQMHLAVTPVDMPSAAPFLVLHRRFSQVSTKRQISTLPADSTKAHHLGYCPQPWRPVQWNGFRYFYCLCSFLLKSEILKVHKGQEYLIQLDNLLTYLFLCNHHLDQYVEHWSMCGTQYNTPEGSLLPLPIQCSFLKEVTVALISFTINLFCWLLIFE